MAILETKALTRCFGKLTAVDHLTLAVEAGEVFGLVGPNGGRQNHCNQNVAAIGTPAELKASIGGNGKTLDDVFIHYAGDTLESGGSYRETITERRTARRLG